jgi:hypothetical protein
MTHHFPLFLHARARQAELAYAGPTFTILSQPQAQGIPYTPSTETAITRPITRAPAFSVGVTLAFEGGGLESRPRPRFGPAGPLEGVLPRIPPIVAFFLQMGHRGLLQLQNLSMPES